MSTAPILDMDISPTPQWGPPTNNHLEVDEGVHVLPSPTEVRDLLERAVGVK
jgi:hypothetical protein